MSWETVKLGQVIKLEYGKGLDEKDRFLDGAHPAFGANGIKSRTNLYLYDKPSIIVGRKGSAGELTLVSEKFWALDVSYYLVHDQSKTDLRYLFFALLTKNLPKFARGVKPGINRNDIYELEIPLPPLSEQQKIVTKLDAIFLEIDKARAAVEVNIKNAEALFQSYLTEVFKRRGEGWVEKKLSDITTKIGSGATPKGGNQSYKKIGISLIRSMNVYDDGFYYTKLAFIDELQAKNLSNVTVEKEDVLLNITGASVARCCVVPDDILPARVNQHVSILRCNKDLICPRLLQYILISPLNKNLLLNVGESGGTTRQAITKSQLLKYSISFPESIESQNKLVKSLSSFYNSTLTIKKSYENKLNNLSTLKQSILQQAFNGELVKE